jgi:hypothetical protein
VDAPALNGNPVVWVSILRPGKSKPIADVFDFADHDTEPNAGFSEWLDSISGGVSPPLYRHVTWGFRGPNEVKEPVIEPFYGIRLYDSHAVSSDLFYEKLCDVNSVTHSTLLKEPYGTAQSVRRTKVHGDWLAGRAAPGLDAGLKLRAFLKKQRTGKPRA